METISIRNGHSAGETKFGMRERRLAVVPLKAVIILMLLAILASLFSGLVFLLREPDGRRTLRALTWRIGLSLALFALLMIAFLGGILTGHP
jgi:hypothetical protein